MEKHMNADLAMDRTAPPAEPLRPEKWMTSMMRESFRDGVERSSAENKLSKIPELNQEFEGLVQVSDATSASC